MYVTRLIHYKQLFWCIIICIVVKLLIAVQRSFMIILLETALCKKKYREEMEEEEIERETLDKRSCESYASANN
jgi:hypothetical protein